MSAALVTTNLAQLHKALGLYVKASGKTFEEVLAKKGAQLGYQLRLEFRDLQPEKGWIRKERLLALKRGQGVRVRPSVYAKVGQQMNALPLAGQVMLFRTKAGKVKGTTLRGGKRLNLQALAVRAELNLREKGRGFLGQSAKFIGAGGKGFQAKAKSRYGQYLAKAGLSVVASGPELKMVWGGINAMSDDAVKGIMRARGLKAVASAISAVTEDMVPYLAKKLELNAEQMGLRA